MDEGLMPKGEALRKAVRWLSDRRREEPSSRMIQLIGEASARFDLSPLEEQFLLDHLLRAEEDLRGSPPAE